MIGTVKGLLSLWRLICFYLCILLPESEIHEAFPVFFPQRCFLGATLIFQAVGTILHGLILQQNATFFLPYPYFHDMLSKV